MKKIAVILPGELPVPALQGGAIETLTEYYIKENESTHFANFVVFNQEKYEHTISNATLNYCNTQFVTIHTNKKIENMLHLANVGIRKYVTNKIPLYSSYLNKCCRYIKKEKFDEVIVEGMPLFAWTIYAGTGIKPVLHLHTDLLYKDSLNAEEIVDSCKKIVCVSQYIANRVNSVCENAAVKTEVCMNGIDTEAFSPKVRAENRERIRIQYGIQPEEFVFTYFGRIDPMKGIRELINAYQACCVPKKRLMIVGGTAFGNSAINVFWEEIQRVAQQDSSIIVTGYIPHNELPTIISATDTAVLPSKYNEAALLTGIEAMAMGIPAIVSDRGGTAEYKCSELSLTVNLDTEPEEQIRKAMEWMALGNVKSRKDATARWTKKAYSKRFFELLDTQ